MRKHLTGLVVWVIVFGVTVSIMKWLGAGELLQGSFGAILAMHVDRIMFPED